MSSDWTAGPNRGTTTATGSVCRSSGRSRGSGFYPGPHPTSESAPTLSEPAVPCERGRHAAARPRRHARRRRHAGDRRAGTSSTPRPTTSGIFVAGFPRGRFSASPGTRVLSFSRRSTTSPADPLRGTGPLGAREGAGDVAAGRIERSARPLPVAGAGLDQTAQRLVCGAALRAILDGHLIASQAERAVDMADRTGPASSRTPHPAAEQTGSQVLRAPVAAALSSPPPDPLPGLAAALRGFTHKAAIFPDLYRVAFTFPRISVTVDTASTTGRWPRRS